MIAKGDESLLCDQCLELAVVQSVQQNTQTNPIKRSDMINIFLGKVFVCKLTSKEILENNAKGQLATGRRA